MKSIDNELGITEKIDENSFSKLLKRLSIKLFYTLLF